ncbi:hypothetical protein [Streptomyces buecherae]|uniref:hypothetical protein n=1 Tax=Streptomyces buecherae TaxID=2763006 RepID=UPI0036C2CC30
MLDGYEVDEDEALHLARLLRDAARPVRVVAEHREGAPADAVASLIDADDREPTYGAAVPYMRLLATATSSVLDFLAQALARTSAVGVAPPRPEHVPGVRRRSLCEAKRVLESQALSHTT